MIVMNKKGFTLVELIIVIVIIGIIVVLAVPAVLDTIEENRTESAKAVEKLLIQNLEIYNNDRMYGGYENFERINSSGQEIQISDRKSDLWEIEKLINIGSYCKHVDYEELVKLNNDIEMGECLLTSADKSLTIERVVTQDSSNAKKYIVSYKYYADIVCGKRLTSDNGYVLSSGYKESDVYYKTPVTNKPTCS